MRQRNFFMLKVLSSAILSQRNDIYVKCLISYTMLSNSFYLIEFKQPNTMHKQQWITYHINVLRINFVAPNIRLLLATERL